MIGSPGPVVLILAMVICGGVLIVVGLVTMLQRRDFRRRTQDADAWVAAGYGFPQAALDRAMSETNEPAYPDEQPIRATSQ